MGKVVSVFAISSFVNFGGPLFSEQIACVADSLLLRLYSQANDDSEVAESIESGDFAEC